MERYVAVNDEIDDFGILIAGKIDGILIKASGTTSHVPDRKSLAFEAYLFPKNLEN